MSSASRAGMTDPSIGVGAQRTQLSTVRRTDSSEFPATGCASFDIDRTFPGGHMRAIVVTEFGGSEVLKHTDYEDPRPGPGEIVIDVAASGVNFRDVYERTGAYPKDLPYIPGGEG